MKKIIVLLCLSLVVLLGCSSTSVEEASTQETTDTLNMLLPYNPDDPNNNEMDVILTEATGQEVEYALLPADDASTKLQLELSSESTYQMMIMYPTDFTTASQSGALLDLSPYLEEYGQNILNAFPEEVWNAVTDPTTGAIYGVPVLGMNQLITSTILVRTDMLAEYGYEVPTTTEELKTVTCGLAEDGVQTPYASTYKVSSDLTIRGAFGVPWDWNLDPETGEYVHISQDPRWNEYVQYEASLYECGAFGNDYETITYDDAIQRFINGDAAFVPINSWDLPKIAASLEAQGLDYTEMTAVVPVIEGPNGEMTQQVTGVAINSVWTVPANAEQYAQQCITWLNAAMDPAVQAEFYLGGAPYDAETNPTGSYTITEDGTISVYDENGNILSEPAPTFYQTIPLTYDIKAARMELESVNRVNKGNGDNLTPEDAESWYAAQAAPYNQYGVVNPLSLQLFTPVFGDVAAQVQTAAYDWGTMAVAGKADQTFEEMSAEVAAQYNMDAVNEEINSLVK